MELYFLARVSAADVDPARAPQPENIRAYRWWTLAELGNTQETVHPIGLADLVATVAAGRPLKQPVVLNGWQRHGSR